MLNVLPENEKGRNFASSKQRNDKATQAEHQHNAKLSGDDVRQSRKGTSVSHWLVRKEQHHPDDEEEKVKKI